MFLLAKVKKDELGIKYKVVGYGITFSGLVLVILSICFGVVMLLLHGGGKRCHSKKGYHSEKMNSHYNYTIGKFTDESAYDGKSGATKLCEKKSKCASTENDCKKGHKKIIKKIVTNEGGEEIINVEVIVE